MSAEIKLIRLPAVCEITGFTRQQIYLLRKTAGFPQPIRIGVRQLAWHKHEVETWIMTRPRVEPKAAA